MPKPKRPNMTLREQEDAAKIQCYDWNAQYKEGVTVTYEELLGSGESIQTKTCGRAFVMCCEPVIMVVVFRRRPHHLTGCNAWCAYGS